MNSSSDKDKIIAVQEELIEHLQKRVKEVEEALEKKTTLVKEDQNKIKELEEKLETTTNLKNQLLENLSRRSTQ